MMKKPDFVKEVVALAQELTGLDARGAKKFDAELRQRYGGDQVRIAARPPLTLEQVNDGLSAGKPVRAIASDLGVGRLTIYRLIWASKSRKDDKTKHETT